MRNMLAPGGLAALLLFLAAPAPAQEKAQSSEYYPLEVGTTWHYQSRNQKITVRVAEHEKIGEATTARLETLVNGKVIATENVGVGKDGSLYRYAMEKIEAKPPILFLKLPFKAGQTWDVTSKAGNQTLKVTFTEDKEAVKVPAGQYPDAIVTRTSKFQVGPQQASAEIWYVKGVGMVKTAMVLGGESLVMELVKFEPGKKAGTETGNPTEK